MTKSFTGEILSLISNADSSFEIDLTVFYCSFVSIFVADFHFGKHKMPNWSQNVTQQTQ